MRYLLDTCTFLWTFLEPEKISEEAKKVLEDTNNELFLSNISSWEITIKYLSGNLKLKFPPSQIIPKHKYKLGV